MRIMLLPAARLFVMLTVLTGILYPLAVTGLASLLFPHRAGGSLIVIDGKVIGSELLAQKFSDARYFWPRPSAADYATVPSGASNLGWTSAKLKVSARQRERVLKKAHPYAENIPAEMLFASGSGLDPDFSPEAARYQMERVATARGFNIAKKRKLAELVDRLTEPPQWSFFGQPRVNVLLLNIELDELEQIYDGK